MIETNKKSIIIFDGLCNLCNASVHFILKHDKKQKFLFASLQSDAATKILLHLNYKINDLNEIVLIENNKIYNKSTAVLRIAKELRPLWNCFYGLIVIPKSMRDLVYDVIAKYRYTWFGKQDTCHISGVENKNRFINN